MRKFTAPILLALAVLLLSPTEGWSLPPCPGSPTRNIGVAIRWTNCVGTFTFSKGNKYVGEWKDNKRHGQGTLTLANGKVLKEGIWKNDKFQYARKKVPPQYARKRVQPSNGYATFIYSNGDKYVGDWKNGKPHGQGAKTYQHGYKYVGAWKNGNWNGQGTKTFADGRVLEGIWKDDRFQYARKAPSPRRARRRAGSLPPCPGSPSTDSRVFEKWTNCVGTFTTPNGNKYVGEYKDNKRHGQGTFTFASGTK